MPRIVDPFRFVLIAVAGWMNQLQLQIIEYLRGLERMILFGEESLRTAIHHFVVHYHTERDHQGLANRLISPEAGHLGNAGVVQRRQRLGGTLNYYYRAAA